jgi:hypothetical protein
VAKCGDPARRANQVGSRSWTRGSPVLLGHFHVLLRPFDVLLGDFDVLPGQFRVLLGCQRRLRGRWTAKIRYRGVMSWARAALALLASATLVGCRAKSAAPDDASAPIATASSDRAALRDDARLLLERHCGPCHLAGEPGALPAALAVFDLREEEWSARMTDGRLREALRRLGEPLPPDGAPNDVSDAERARFARFADGEILRHARSDAGP